MKNVNDIKLPLSSGVFISTCMQEFWDQVEADYKNEDGPSRGYRHYLRA